MREAFMVTVWIELHKDTRQVNLVKVEGEASTFYGRLDGGQAVPRRGRAGCDVVQGSWLAGTVAVHPGYLGRTARPEWDCPIMPWPARCRAHRVRVGSVVPVWRAMESGLERQTVV